MDDSEGSDSVKLAAVKRRSVRTAIFYSFKDSRRRWGTYALDIFVIAMVCFILVLMRGISSRTPVLYTNFAEQRVGESDLLLQANPAPAVRKSPGSPVPDICDCDDLVLGSFLPVRSLGPFLTDIQSSSEILMGFFARNLFLGSVAGKDADRSSSSRVTMMFYGHDKENAINVGKNWDFRKLGEQEAFADDQVLRLISVAAAMGERADLTFELSPFLSILNSYLSARSEPVLFFDDQMALYQKANETYIGLRADPFGLGNTDDLFSSSALGSEVIEGSTYVVMPLNQAVALAFGGDAAQLATEVAIADSVAKPGGKWSSALGNVVALEKAHFELLLRGSLRQLREANELNLQDLEGCFQVGNHDPGIPGANGFSAKQWVPSQARPEQSCGTDTTSRSLETLREDFVSSRQGPLGESFRGPNSLGNILGSTEDMWMASVAETPSRLDECIARIFVTVGIDMLTNSTRDMNIEDFTSQVTVLHKQRSDIYGSGLQSSRRQLRALADEVSVALGVDYAVNITTPVLNDLELNEIFSILIDQIFFIVFVCIMLLTTLLLFSIATFDADKRSYEYAMLRTLGLRTKELIILVISKGLQITIPALLLGLAFALLGLLMVDIVLEAVAGGEVDLTVNAGFFIVAVLAGFVIPFLAHTLPSRKALAKSLNTAIDISRHKQSEMKVIWKNPRKFNVDLLLVIVGLVLVAFGGIFFYGIPRSFNDGNLSLFLGLLNVIVMGMLFSLSIIVQLLSPLCEKAFSYILMPPGTRDARMRSVVMRQLFTHRPKTRNSSIMYTIALGFFIFSGSLVSQQSLGISHFLQEYSGADVHAFRVDSGKLDVDVIIPVLDNLVERGVVEDFTFVTRPRRITLGQIIGQGLDSLRVYGLQDNFFKVVFESAVLVHRTAADYSTVGDLDDFFQEDSGAVPRAFGDVPYLDRLPSILSGRSEEVGDVATPILIGAATALEPAIGVSPDVPLLATKRAESAISHASVLFTKVPIFFFSGMQAAAGETSVLVSESKLGELLGEGRLARDKVSLLIKVRADTEAELRSNSLVVEGSLHSSVQDTLIVMNVAELADSVSTVSTSLNVYFIIIGLVSIILCFVMLWTTVAANVSEGTWELAVMRSIGFTKFQIIRLHIYENLLQVFTSTMLGTASGVLISLMLALQYSIFQERPAMLLFPWALFFLLVGSSLLTAIIAPAVIVSNTYARGIAATLRSI